MVSSYTHTGFRYREWALDEMRAPVLSGVGHASMEAAAQAYRQLGGILSQAGDDVRAALTAAAAFEGEAADASRAHLERLALTGEVGAAQARLAAIALEDQATYHVDARNEMLPLVPREVAPGLRGLVPEATPQELNDLRDQVIRVADRYQTNTNHNLDNGFQAFVPPQDQAVDLAPAATGGPVQWGGATAPAGAGPVSPSSGAAGGPPVGGPPAPPSTAQSAPPVVSGTGAGGIPAPGAVVPDARPGPGRTGVGPPPTPGAAVPVGVPRVPPTGPGVPARPAWPTGPGGSGRSGGGAGSGAVDGPSGPAVPRSGGFGSATPRLGDGGAARPPAVGGGPAVGGPADGARPAAPPRAGTSGATPGHVPMTGTGGGSGAQDREHRRPPWLVQDDPESFWFAGLPPHVDPVIRGEQDGPGG